MSQFIEWKHDGRQPLIRVSILAPAPHSDLRAETVEALVDTGSTTSGITSRIADSLGIVGIGKRPLVSARSDDQVERYVFRVGLTGSPDGIPSFPFVFDGIIGFELRPGFRFEALIGMDILSQCDLSMDRRGRCALRFG